MNRIAYFGRPVQVENLILRSAANGGESRRMLQKATHASSPSLLWRAPFGKLRAGIRGRFAAPQGEVLARTQAVEMFHVKQAGARNEI
jgi:hypothetical protein